MGKSGSDSFAEDFMKISIPCPNLAFEQPRNAYRRPITSIQSQQDGTNLGKRSIAGKQYPNHYGCELPTSRHQGLSTRNPQQPRLSIPIFRIRLVRRQFSLLCRRESAPRQALSTPFIPSVNLGKQHLPSICPQVPPTKRLRGLRRIALPPVVGMQ